MRGRDALATAAGTAALQNFIFYREPPLLARFELIADAFDFAGVSFEDRVCPIDAATRFCSSAVNWKM